VVVVTGNHYWADGLVELVICAAALLAVRAWMRMASRRQERREPTPSGDDPADRPPVLASPG